MEVTMFRETLTFALVLVVSIANNGPQDSEAHGLSQNFVGFYEGETVYCFAERYIGQMEGETVVCIADRYDGSYSGETVYCSAEGPSFAWGQAGNFGGSNGMDAIPGVSLPTGDNSIALDLSVIPTSSVRTHYSVNGKKEGHLEVRPAKWLVLSTGTATNDDLSATFIADVDYTTDSGVEIDPTVWVEFPEARLRVGQRAVSTGEPVFTFGEYFATWMGLRARKVTEKFSFELFWQPCEFTKNSVVAFRNDLKGWGSYQVTETLAIEGFVSGQFNGSQRNYGLESAGIGLQYKPNDSLTLSAGFGAVVPALHTGLYGSYYVTASWEK